MIQKSDVILIKAIAICYKSFLKPEEALIYCNLGRTQFAKKSAEFLIFKSKSGYYKREDLNRMMSGEMPTPRIADKDL